jgi:hypothetical protein
MIISALRERRTGGVCGVNRDRWARLNSLDRSVHMGVVILHAGERMLVAALPESFESMANHRGVLLSKRSALRLERDAGGDLLRRRLPFPMAAGVLLGTLAAAS